jgi:hypothetical protein
VAWVIPKPSYPRKTRWHVIPALCPIRTLRVSDILITRLGGPRMAQRPEHAVEEFVTAEGRDVLRQALQDHLDARAAAEPRLAEVVGAGPGRKRSTVRSTRRSSTPPRR